MKFDREFAKQKVKECLAEFEGAKYSKLIEREGYESTTEMRGPDGTIYSVWHRIVANNDAGPAIEVECMVTQKDGRNWLPPNESGDLLIWD